MPRKPASVYLHLNDSGGLALGDAIVHLPFIRAFKQWAPESLITVSPATGGVNALWPLFEPYVHQRLDGIPNHAGTRFDWTFDLVGESAASTMAVRRLAQKRFYSIAARGWMHLPRLPIYHGKHVVRRRLGLLAQAIGYFPSDFWPWPVPPDYAAAAANLLPVGPSYVFIAPGAGNTGRNKLWPLERYVDLARCQEEVGRVPVIILGPQELGWEKHFAEISSARFPLAENADNNSGVPSDPALTVALAGSSAAAVTNCCGAGHMFALGGASLISIFGPTNYRKSAAFARYSICVIPANKKSRRVEDVELPDVLAAIDYLLNPSQSVELPPNIERVSFPEISMNSSRSIL